MRRVFKLFIYISLLVSCFFSDLFFIKKAEATELSDLFFEQNYDVIKELEGQTIKGKNKVYSKKEFFKFFSNSQPFASLSAHGNLLGLINTKQNTLLTFPITDLEGNIIEVECYPLPGIFSIDTRMYYISSLLNGLLLDRIIIIDEESGQLIIMSRDVNGEYYKIINAFRFNRRYSLNGLQIICGYIDNGLLKTVYYKKGKVYIVESDTLKLEQTKIYKWFTISGYSYPASSRGKVDSVYLYQVNKNNVLRKYDLINNKSIFVYDLNRTPIRGKILKIITDWNLIYLLTEFNGKSTIYVTNEENFEWFKYTNIFENGSSFGKILDINYFKNWREDGFVLSQMNMYHPVEIISSFGGIWREIQPDSEQLDEKEANNRNIVITKVITDIAKWNHPTKEVFKKYGYNLTKIEFTQNNTYPIFYVKSDVDLVFSNEPFIEELANKNGYWDFAIKIGIYSLEVTCNKKQRKVMKENIIVEP